MQKSIYPNKNPVNMASPPSFGITLSCICLPPGISTAPIYTASFFINGIKHATNKKTIAIILRLSNKLLLILSPTNRIITYM